jgi:HSP20 family protein
MGPVLSVHLFLLIADGCGLTAFGSGSAGLGRLEFVGHADRAATGRPQSESSEEVIPMLGYMTNFEGGLLEQFERLQREMDEMLARPFPTSIRAVARGTFPAINVGASRDQVDVYVFAAGVEPASLDIRLQQNLLTITGERKLEEKEGVTYYLRERFNGTFRRALTLPDDVDPDKVQASYKEGVLHITVQRRAEVKPRRIQVK